ncbi:MAG TPA: nucleotidyltransferase domain-containing protein [Gemmataceae bacterium]|nr:nucleotidyltransferase domain-containing protein [Gemmataceae bacterium]
MSAIRRFARDVAERFKPDKIILFGSYAYGTPNRDSDVDILVVMPCRNRIGQAVNIRWDFPVPFSMDLIVRTPRQLADRIKYGDSFMSEIVTQGKVLHERLDAAVGKQS